MTPAGQRWTRSKPTEPGWYWWRVDYQTVYVVKVGVIHIAETELRLLVVWLTYNGSDYVEMDDSSIVGEWQGPITPNEATE